MAKAGKVAGANKNYELAKKTHKVEIKEEEKDSLDRS